MTDRTIVQWRMEQAPLHDPEKMAEWSASRKRLTPGFRARLAELVGASEEPAAGGAPKAATDWEAFEKTARTSDPKEAMVKLEKARDFAAFKFEAAARNNKPADQKFYADLLAKMEGTLHDAQLRAKKLGLDEGELIPRAEMERIAWAVAYWLLRAADAHLDSLTSRLVAMAPGLTEKAVRGVLEPELISDRFLVPFARGSKMQAGVTIPEWLVETMRRACGDFIEKGEAAFDEHASP